MIRASYDASFAKLVSLVAYLDSRRSENLRILTWPVSLVSSIRFLNYVSGFGGNVRERFGNFHRRVVKTLETRVI